MIEITIDLVSRIGLSRREGHLRVHESRDYGDGWKAYNYIFIDDGKEYRGTVLQREYAPVMIGYLVLGAALEDVALKNGEPSPNSLIT